MNATTPTFDQQLIGQTEKTMNAILERLLIPTGLTEPEWVTLVLSAAGDTTATRDELTVRVASALKTDEASAANHIQALATKDLIQPAPNERSTVTLTAAGRQLLNTVRSQTGEITERLWGDLPDADLVVAGRVLKTVLDRAEAELKAEP